MIADKKSRKKFLIVQQMPEQVVERAPRINDPEAQLFSFLLLVVMKTPPKFKTCLNTYRRLLSNNY
jgi:hypothetical protein